eukprot:GHVS01062816.1.p1 GENE.GHVS01062816.1~~GHVS01062816.1.p1  ORF type:complete len:582 (-),score=137.44 GHVS01062816.1:315-2060(-)
MSAVNIVNPKADVLRRAAALSANSNAAKGLQEVLRSNLGPRGTLKMLVGGAGQIKVTKDGNVLLQEMQIQHPTASMIARAATALDTITGDGTTSNVLAIGEMMRWGERFVTEGIHPHILCEGIDLARKELIRWMDDDKESAHIRVKVAGGGGGKGGSQGGEGAGKGGGVEEEVDRELLMSIARTSLRTKLHGKMADHLTAPVVDAVLLIRQKDTPIDLFMVELMHMQHKVSTESRLVRGMVLDHGCRHPDMPDHLTNCYILTLNVSLEYEKSEVNSGFFYSNVSQREKLVMAERKFTDDKVRKIIELKRKVCCPPTTASSATSDPSSFGFVVLNQKGIDPPSLDLLAKEGIMALRRVKRRNMERLTLCCGGEAINCVDDLQPSDLGFADEVFQQSLGDDKYTFVEGVRNPQSCTLLLKGPNEHTIAQMKDAIRDGLRAVKNALDDGCVVPGAGAFEIAAYEVLQEYKKTVAGKRKYGIDILGEALLAIPKTLAENSGLDVQDSLLKLIEEYQRGGKCKTAVGLDVATGEPMCPNVEGIWDNYCVKRQMLSIGPALAQNLLQVDEIMRAGKAMGGGGGGPNA